ncbi:hypothetical protein DERF_012987 [Dermatophagoides farinae]|uniref:Uncharacterized protein n=1 Tax=Dermatophagoides farinae TaxID=6954 RepID=A0A922KUC9_DERFA|nr:hypothetical protein DERF_012987 [Dermatophagoides farinae]
MFEGFMLKVLKQIITDDWAFIYSFCIINWTYAKYQAVNNTQIPITLLTYWENALKLVDFTDIHHTNMRDFTP